MSTTKHQTASPKEALKALLDVLLKNKNHKNPLIVRVNGATSTLQPGWSSAHLYFIRPPEILDNKDSGLFTEIGIVISWPGDNARLSIPVEANMEISISELVEQKHQTQERRKNDLH